MECRFEHWAFVLVVLGSVGGSFVACSSGPQPPAVTACEAPVASCPGPVGQWEFLGLSSKHLDGISAIAVDRCNPRTIYAGTSASFSGGLPSVLFKSTDCGQSWDTLFVGSIQGGGITDLDLDPKRPEVVYMLPGPALKSIDGGQTWHDITEDIQFVETRAQDLALHPREPRIVYLSTGGFGSGRLFKSLNGGASWTNLETENFATSSGQVAISSSDPRVVYALKFVTGDVYRSDDGGRSWTKTHLRKSIDEPDEVNTVHDILVDADSANVIYAGLGIQVPFRGDPVEGPLLVRSRDGGKTWQAYSTGLPRRGFVRKLAQHEQTGELFLVYTGGGGELYRHAPGANRWVPFGVDSLRSQSHSHGSLEVVETDNSLYFGLDGLYRMKLPSAE